LLSQTALVVYHDYYLGDKRGWINSTSA